MKIVETATEESVAEFGASGATIGKATENHWALSSGRIAGVDSNGAEVFRIYTDGVSQTVTVQDAINKSYTVRATYDTSYVQLGTFELNVDGFISDTFIILAEFPYNTGNTASFSFEKGVASTVSHMIRASASVLFQAKIEYDGDETFKVYGFYPDVAYASSRIFRIMYAEYTFDIAVCSFDIGTRAGAPGKFSTVIGQGNTASGDYSTAEGEGTTASERATHAEGQYSVASGWHSHAENTATIASGIASHAENTATIASGTASHAEGVKTEANGEGSHTGGIGTIADSDYQTAIGMYNESDANSIYALIIGNGQFSASLNQIIRSDAFRVGWDGNVELALDTTAASGTTDGDLYDAITALGWESEVIA